MWLCHRMQAYYDTISAEHFFENLVKEIQEIAKPHRIIINKPRTCSAQ